MKSKSNALSWLWISAVVILIDQFCKKWAIAHIGFQKITLLPFLNLTVRFNTGAAFSFLGSQSGWQLYFFAGIAAAASIFIVFWLNQLRAHEVLKSIALCLILGGAVGNLIDRISFGYVIDFIDFHVNAWHFATFNMADAAVTIGTILLIIGLIHESTTRQS